MNTKRDDQKEDSLQSTEYMFINNLDSWKTRHANRCWMDGEALLLMFAVPWACWSCRQERARMRTRRLNRAISRRKLHADSTSFWAQRIRRPFTTRTTAAPYAISSMLAQSRKTWKNEQKICKGTKIRALIFLVASCRK
jgi:hypothetical protein